MSNLLPFIIIGITVGSVYGLSAMGLVLTYKTTGVLNFAHGALGATAAYVFLKLRQDEGLPWPLAAVISVVLLGAVLGLAMERLSAGLAKVGTAYRIVATVGLLLGTLAALRLAFGLQLLFFDSFLSREAAFTVDGVRVSVSSVVIFLIGVVSAAALSYLFRYTRTGMAMRAVVDDPQLVDLTGFSPVKIRRTSWLFGACFAALSGVLFAEIQQGVDAVLLSFLVIQTFGAAAIGAFTSVLRAYVGGLALGVAQAVMSKLISGNPSALGLDTNVPFLALIIVLLVLPRARLVEVGKQVRVRAAPPTRFTPKGRLVLGFAFLGAVLIPFVVGSKLPIWTTAVTQVVLFASLGLLVHSAGQISLCQWGFAAVGGVAFAHMLQDGVPWGLAALIAALITAPVGALISIPAIRLSGLYLGLATLGFGVLLAGFFYQKSYFFGVRSQLPTRRPEMFGLDTDRGIYYLVLLFAILALVFVVMIERSRLGRLLRGLADSPVALATLGANINQTRLLVFTLSAFLAGFAGALYSSLFGSINVDTFNYIVSIQLLAVAVVAGRRTVTASIVAPLLLVVLPGYVTNATFDLYLQLAFGALAVVAALLSQTSLTEVTAGLLSRTSRFTRERSGSTTSDRLQLVNPRRVRRA